VPTLSVTTNRTPVREKSRAGAVGTLLIVPLNLTRSSPGGAVRRDMVSFGLAVVVGAMLLQRSHGSGTVSPSVSVKGGLGGQAALLPVQVSAGSQAFVEARHTVPAAASASGGQLFDVPSQVSATSQTSVAARQTAVLLRSVGQLAEDPVQFSARS